MARRSAKAGAAPPLARLFSDKPLRGKVLRFEFEGYAKTLAELALNGDNETPFTVVVRGGWGRGKTTLLRRAQWMMENPDEAGILEDPKQGRKVRTVWFNAWKYSSDDMVMAGLLGELLDTLRKGGFADQIKMLMASYKGSVLEAALKVVLPGSLGDLVDLEDRYQLIRDQRAFHDTFRQLFSEVSRLFFGIRAAAGDTAGLSEDFLWSPEKQRTETLAVFLDDLDRCRPERAVEVLEAINLFLDLPGVCFFLGIDWERLVALLPETVKGQENQFLEKIVQVAFDLPRVSAPDAETYIRELIGGTSLAQALAGPAEGETATGDGSLRVLAESLDPSHPRHVKRFLNDLSITLAVMRNTGRLGPKTPDLPEPAVFAWHLLSEVLSEEKWIEVRALPQNLDNFLREWTESRAKKDGEEKAEGEWQRMGESGLVTHCLDVLRRLDGRQRHALVYLAAPPEMEVARTKPSRPEGTDLFDLNSRAWVEIPGGSFAMGSEEAGARDNEKPVHGVTLSPYRITRFPVTNADYALYVKKRGSPPEHWQGGEIPEGKDRHPVVEVSWSDAKAFCAWLTKRLDGVGETSKAVLPTEAQWEFAARGEEGRKYPWGGEEPSDRRANFGGEVGDTTIVGSSPEGATPETGVQDLAGNVWEWCADWVGPYSEEEQTDPIGPDSGDFRVLRGGSFRNGARALRAAFRAHDPPEVRFDFIGFRVVFVEPGGLD